MVVGHLVNQNVIDESAVFVEQAGVVGLARTQFRGVISSDVFDQTQGLRPADFDFPHVAHIE